MSTFLTRFTINQYCFTNISFNFLFSRRIGFPFPDKIEMLPDRNEFMCNMMPARSRITKPLIQRSIKEQGTVIYQPMFPQSLYSEKSAEYDISYVKKYSLNFDCGVGKIMIETDLTHSRWLAVDEKFYLAPNKIQDANQHHIKLSINVLEWQNWLNKSSFSMEKLTPENRRYIRSRQNLAKRINEKLILNSEKIDMKMRARKTLHVQFNQKLS